MNLPDDCGSMRNFGFAGYDRVVELGINGKMSEFSAAVGLSALDCMDEFIQTNYRNYQIYKQRLKTVPGLCLFEYDQREINNFQYVVVLVDESLCKLSRDQLVQVLHAENVLARRYFYPGCHRMEPYHSTHPRAGIHLPITEAIASKVLLLPTGTSVMETTAHTICDILQAAVENSGQVARRLPFQPRLMLDSDSRH